MKLLVLTALLSSIPFASAQEEYPCEFEGVKTIKIDVYPEAPGSQQVDYKFQVIGDVDPEKLVILHIPGGPGGTSMNDFSQKHIRDSFIEGGLPADIPWIMTDPRTAGCNKGDEKIYPDESLTSANLAHDILSVIEKLKLKKYIIHGHSYGTQLATFVGAMANRRGLPGPHAVVLSGVLGLGKADGSFSIPNNLIHEWNLIRQTLRPEILSILSEEAPLGADSYAWKRFIQKGLYNGYFLSKSGMKNSLIEKLQLIDKPEEERKPLMDSLIPPVTESPVWYSDFSDRLYAKIDCHEFSPRDGRVYFSKGELIFDEENDPCKAEPFDRPYDSAELQIEAPLYYFAGTNDPAAPYEGARYHFEHQTNSPRSFVTVNRSGHLKLGYTMWDCKDQIWEKIKKQEDLREVISLCKADIKLEVR